MKLPMISLIFLTSLLGCQHAPKLEWCLSNGDSWKPGFDCHDDATGDERFLHFKDSKNYVALSPDDLETLVNYMKLQCFKGGKESGKIELDDPIHIEDGQADPAYVESDGWRDRLGALKLHY